MPFFSSTQEQKLQAKFLKGGHVFLASQAGSREVIHATALAEMLRRFSRRTGDRPCESFELRGFYVEGELDLNGAGLEGSPLLPMHFVDCLMPDGIDIEEAFLKGLTIENPAVQPLPKNSGRDHVNSFGCLSARGVTILDEFRLKIPDALTDVRIDLSHSRLKGGARLQQLNLATSASTTVPLSLADATVTGNLLLEGVQITAAGEHALDGDNLNVIGCFKLRPFKDQVCPRLTELHGTLKLRNVRVGGQFVFEAVHLSANPPQERAISLMAEDAEIGGDLCFYNEGHPNDLARPAGSKCIVTGQMNFMGAHVHGDLRVFGEFKSTDNRIRAFKAERIHVDGDMHFGWIPGGKDHTGCHVNGECDFSNATVAGEVIFSGSTHELSRGKLASTARRKRGVAINLRGANIAGDLRCEGSMDRGCRIEGLSAIGATIKGRLILRGAELIALKQPGQNRKAITANGSTIRGGIFVTEDEFSAGKFSVIDGGFRLRNATVNGPVIFRGAALSAKSVAFWASNTVFGTDVIFMPCWKKGEKEQRTTVSGELRLFGTIVTGTLYLKGVTAHGSKRNGVVLDGYTGEFKKGVVIEPYRRFEHEEAPGEKTAEFLSSEMEGLISLNFARAQSLRFGTVPLRKRPDERRFVRLRGSLLLRGLQLQGDVEIANATLLPVSEILDGRIQARALKRLESLGVYRDLCIVHASYAALGTRLYVCLRDDSHGLINLYAASTGTIGGFSGNEDPEGNGAHESWKAMWRAHLGTLKCGERPPHNPKAANQSLRESWGAPLPYDMARLRGEPRDSSKNQREILLNLDEFTYKRVNDYDEMPECVQWDLRKYWYFLLGRPTPQQLRPRISWLQRQVKNPHTKNPAIISPYRQLASVYREMGDLKRSYMYIRERRWIQIRFGNTGWVQKFIDTLFSLFSGFGYSPTRAASSLVVLLLFSIVFVHRTAHMPIDRPAATAEPEVQATVAVNALDLKIMGRTSQTIGLVHCRGLICSAASDGHLSCHVVQTPNGFWTSSYETVADALNIILPFAHLGSGPGCVLDSSPSIKWWRFYLAMLQFFSWILFPLAALTFSGVLREKDP